ncbi:factor-independent urate hydroxylase [Aquabacter cavernae]|uniref:factor-independent urate hydroxylase n=1 Tax=Aquabacter cavernae TaxID=2496029 RepID=UPI000F8F4CCD|nr:urate oxidase [Aquabacter cavernae]
MTLVSNTYGKARVRVLRVKKDGPRHDVRELSVLALVTGDFAASYVAADNSKMICTDTVKNVVNVVAREQLDLDTEAFCAAVADKLLTSYPQVESATVTAHETKWDRLSFHGAPHPHSFTLDSNGKPFAKVVATRDKVEITSGISGFTFMKTTGSAWDNFHTDPYTTLKETRDRICATAMEASWRWSGAPEDYKTANATILSTLIEVFATTFSESVQDSLYRMGSAVLAKVPEVIDISLACPNKHYLLINLSAFDLDNDNVVFVPTDEPHGQIECTVGR